jgi:hypothetical protein
MSLSCISGTMGQSKVRNSKTSRKQQSRWAGTCNLLVWARPIEPNVWSVLGVICTRHTFACCYLSRGLVADGKGELLIKGRDLGIMLVVDISRLFPADAPATSEQQLLFWVRVYKLSANLSFISRELVEIVILLQKDTLASYALSLLLPNSRGISPLSAISLRTFSAVFIASTPAGTPQ